MRLGIAFSLLPTGASATPADAPDDAFEEFDKPETVDAIAAVLRSRGHEVELLGDGREFLTRVLDDPPDLVWNMAEGHGTGRSREARVPAVLEMLGIPYTGSDPLTLAATLDKQVAKQLVNYEWHLAIPEGMAVPAGCDPTGFADRAARAFQHRSGRRVILKPNLEGSSKGIRGQCLATTVDEAYQIYLRLADDYGGPVLVEEFIAGDELTVGLIGNGSSVEVIGAMQVIPRRPDPNFVYSLEVKRDWANLVDYEAPARLASDDASRLEMAARLAFIRLGCRDVCRIDYRLREGIPYFIEANPLPGLAPVTSDLVILAQGHGISHEQLISRIFETALGRLGIDEGQGR